VVAELIFGSHVNTLVVVEWVIHVNDSPNYASDEKRGTKREKEKKILRFLARKRCRGQTMSCAEGRLS
jgi:hypothetical protein